MRVVIDSSCHTDWEVGRLEFLQGKKGMCGQVEYELGYGVSNNMRTNLLNWSNLVSINKNVVFYAFGVVRVYKFLVNFKKLN